MRVFWNVFITLIGAIGIAAGIVFAVWMRTVPPVSYLLIFGGMALILAPIFRWAFTPTAKRQATRPAPHAPHHRYGAFEVKTAPGPRDWRPPTDN